MKRNKIMTPPSQDRLLIYKRRIAFHEAGHAAGIHLNNKSKQLAPVSFKLVLKERACEKEEAVVTYQASQDNHIAHVKGGRLIELLPDSFDGFVHNLMKHNEVMTQQVDNYRLAFESDIINLFIGPLAEAKHIADTDDELFNLQLINPQALKNYGGNANLALINEYLQCLFFDKQIDEKLDELFTEAFDFVNNDVNWAAITQLANYILKSSKCIIHHEDIIFMLDQSVANFTDRRTKARHHCHGWFKETVHQIKNSYTLSLENAERPSQALLDSMSQLEKDRLILKLFDLLEKP